MSKDFTRIDEILADIIKRATEAREMLKAEAPSKEVTPEPVAVKKLTLEDVRKVLTEKSRAGYTAKVKELLLKHGANKLSEISPDEYEALVEEAGNINGN